MVRNGELKRKVNSKMMFKKNESVSNPEIVFRAIGELDYDKLHWSLAFRDRIFPGKFAYLPIDVRNDILMSGLNSDIWD